MSSQLLRHSLVISLFALFLNPFSTSATAQAGQSELTGEVRDSSGAVIASVRLTLTSAETSRSSTTTASDSGIYLFTNLRPGIYTVSVEAQGFKRYVREAIKLATGE